MCEKEATVAFNRPFEIMEDNCVKRVSLSAVKKTTQVQMLSFRPPSITSETVTNGFP